MWWIRSPERLKAEVAAIDELAQREAWLTAVTKRLAKNLNFAIDFDITVNDEAIALTLAYPAFFPETLPMVVPSDGRRLSGHQYGAGGELCLEYRSDNWDPAVTGAMMIESAYRLLAGTALSWRARRGSERPPFLARPAVARRFLSVSADAWFARLSSRIAARRQSRMQRRRNLRSQENMDRLRYRRWSARGTGLARIRHPRA